MKLRALLFMLSLTLTGVANSQVVRLNQRLKVRPQLAGTISLTAAPSTVNFTLVPGGVATGSSAITIQSTFAGLSLISSVSLYGYFTSADALSDAAGDILPSSDIYGRCPTGSPTSYTAFNQIGPYGSASSLLIWQSSSIISLGLGRTDVLSLKIDLSATPQLPAGTYTGTLNLRIQAL